PGRAAAARGDAPADPEHRAADPARHALRGHPRLVPGDADRSQPAVPRRGHLHRLQHDLDRGGAPRGRPGLAAIDPPRSGAHPPALLRLLLLEALVLGVLGVLVGLPLGIVLAPLLLGMVSTSMGVIFQLRFPVERLVVEAGTLLPLAAAGIAASLFASYFA